MYCGSLEHTPNAQYNAGACASATLARAGHPRYIKPSTPPGPCGIAQQRDSQAPKNEKWPQSAALAYEKRYCFTSLAAF
jgi:hypothetical protein